MFHNIFKAVFTLIGSVTRHVKNIADPQPTELKAASDDFAKRFDIKDDSLELQIEIVVAMMAHGYSPVRVAIEMIETLREGKQK